MKAERAVPKVNKDGLYIEDTLADDTFTGVVPFYADPPAPGPESPPETDSEAADEQPDEPEIVGYIVGVPVSAGLYMPRFSLEAWYADSNGIGRLLSKGLAWSISRAGGKS